jgi:hypothetical protein
VIKGVLEVVLPLAMLVLFVMALGLALDNHAVTLDPSTPHYVAMQRPRKLGRNFFASGRRRTRSRH